MIGYIVFVYYNVDYLVVVGILLYRNVLLFVFPQRNVLHVETVATNKNNFGFVNRREKTIDLLHCLT